MRKAISLFILLVLASPAYANARPIVEGNQVLYVGGTVPSLKEGTMGRFDTTQEDAIVFQSGEARIAIPYGDIQQFEYQEKRARRTASTVWALSLETSKMATCGVPSLPR